MPMVIRREGMPVTNLLCFEKFSCHERFQDGILVKKKADENDKQDDDDDDDDDDKDDEREGRRR